MAPVQQKRVSEPEEEQNPEKRRRVEDDEEVEDDVVAEHDQQHEVRRAPEADRTRGIRPHVVPVLARDDDEDGEHRVDDRVEAGARRRVEALQRRESSSSG